MNSPTLVADFFFFPRETPLSPVVLSLRERQDLHIEGRDFHIAAPLPPQAPAWPSKRERINWPWNGFLATVCSYWKPYHPNPGARLRG